MKLNFKFKLSREELIRKTSAVIFGNFLCSLALVFILKPNNMIPAGITGVSTLFEHISSINVSAWILILNLPLLILGIFLLSKEFMLFSMLSVFLTSFFVGMLESISPDGFALTNNIMLACIFGGFINGIGGGITFRNGTSTGGFDIIGAVMKKKYNISIGNMLMAMNFVVISSSAFIYSIDEALFTLFSLFVSYQVVDKIQLGVGRQKQLFIISSEHELITKTIYHKISRGVTYINGEGAYTGKSNKIIYLICTPRQLVIVKNLVREIDPKAFMAVSDTAEILGSGFRTIEL
ncbi:MAG: YitT family protein [Peptoniphilaceae bacterium]